MSHHPSDLQQKAKLQRPMNRYKNQQKVDQHKIDEILGQELPGSPPRVNLGNDTEIQQSSKPSQHVGSLQGNAALPTTNKSSKNQKLPVLPPLGSSKKQEYHSVQRPPQRPSQQSHQNLSIDSNVHFNNKRRNSNESNHSNNSNGSRPAFELPRLPKKIDKLGISADLSDLENSDSCSSAPEEFKKTLPKKMLSKSNSIDNFNLTSTTIIDDFFHTSDDSEFGDSDNNNENLEFKNGSSNKQKNDNDDSDNDYSFDEIISDSDTDLDQNDKKKNYHLLTPEELQLCKDTPSVHNEVKQRLDKLIKIARNHFPATKDNTAMLTRLVEQSRACHEFHFLEKRTKYYESENRGLTIALTSLDDIISNPQSNSGNNNNVNINKVKFGLQRLNALQMRQVKRMSKELTQAQRKIKKLRAEISKLHTEMRAYIKARRGGDGSLLIAEMNNNGNNNASNVANFGGGSGADEDELAALKIEHQFAIAKEKAAVGVMQNENEELERIINTYEKRIVLMTQKESNYSRLLKKSPASSNEKPNQKTSTNDKPAQKASSNDKFGQKVSTGAKSSSPRSSQKPENKKEASPSHHDKDKNTSSNSNKAQKPQKAAPKQKQQNEAQKPPPKKESPNKKTTSGQTAQSSPKKKKKEEEEVPIIEVLSI